MSMYFINQFTRSNFIWISRNNLGKASKECLLASQQEINKDVNDQ